jgi:hypothetical protein
MRNWFNRKLIVGAVALAMATTTAFVLAAPRAGEALTVRVLQAKVMKKPSFIGASAANVSRGQVLLFKEAKGGWFHVSSPVDGWIHSTAVTEGQVKLSTLAGSGGPVASRQEVELAGRGFTPEVEDKYRQQNPQLDFHHVDAIEKLVVDSEKLASFARAGKLSAATEGK